MNKGTFDSEIDEQIILATFNKIDIETNHACVDFLRKYANANDFSDNILKVFSKLIKIEIFYNFLNCFFLWIRLKHIDVKENSEYVSLSVLLISDSSSSIKSDATFWCKM